MGSVKLQGNADSVVPSYIVHRCSIVSGSFPRQAQHHDDSVLVVDFNDTVDGAAVRDTQSRHDAYEQLGWDVVAVDSGQVDGGMEGSDRHPTDRDPPLNRTRFVPIQERSIHAGQMSGPETNHVQ